jgi:hypothetical protein
MFPLFSPSWRICHFSSGDRVTRGFLLMVPPIGGPESYLIQQSSFSGEHYIADVCGVLMTEKRVRPLFIEVKVAANNPWFALIENLQQIRLARACAHKIQAFVHQNSKHRVERGVWGLILAPERYYAKHRKNLAQCELLLGAMKQNSRARVAFGISDFLAEGQIKIVAQNWLAVRGSNSAT